MWKEFKEFITRGNVIDLAIGLVMGSAFTAIVTALVENIIMPFITGLTGESTVENLAVSFNGSPIKYGLFLQAIINFLLIAVVLFLAIKGLNSLAALRKKEEAEEEAEEETETEVEAPKVEEYLEEIRDLLKQQVSND